MSHSNHTAAFIKFWWAEQYDCEWWYDHSNNAVKIIRKSTLSNASQRNIQQNSVIILDSIK